MYFDDLIPAVEAEVPMVSDPIYLYGISRAARTFFKETEVWCEPLSHVAIGDGLSKFELEPFEESVIHTVPCILLDGVPLTSVSYSSIQYLARRNGRPTSFHRKGNTVYIAPLPTSEFTLDVLGISVPTMAATQVIADSYMEKYADAIVSLAISFITSMPNKPWTDLTTARVNQARYEEDKLIARREALGYLDKYSNAMNYFGDGNARNSDY